MSPVNLRCVVILAIATLGVASSKFQDSRLSAARNLFTPSNGSYPSLVEAYEAFRTYEILGLKTTPNVSSATCGNVVEVLGSPYSSTLRDAYYALKVNGILECKSGQAAPTEIVSRLQDGVEDALSLIDLYYSVRGLLLVKEQFSANLTLANADAISTFINALSQSDGTWRYSSTSPESTTFAAVKTSILKLFDSFDQYDNGTFYFHEKVNAPESYSPLSTTASVIRGFTSFEATQSSGLNLPGDKFAGLTIFLFGAGIPRDANEFFIQVDALSLMESRRCVSPIAPPPPPSPPETPSKHCKCTTRDRHRSVFTIKTASILSSVLSAVITAIVLFGIKRLCKGSVDYEVDC